MYEYTLAQAQEEQAIYAACEIVKRKADIDARVFTREEILKAGVRDLKTGKPLTEADLTKNEYTTARISTTSCSSTCARRRCARTCSSCCARTAGRSRRSSCSAPATCTPTAWRCR
ncbi:hypothetical protein [Rhodanobacter lindaniclasticus]